MALALFNPRPTDFQQKSMKKSFDFRPLQTYQTIKTSLKRVARNDVVINKLQEATK
jgi:hypothetical protein